jgi:dephospho-CoA kinase
MLFTVKAWLSVKTVRQSFCSLRVVKRSFTKANMASSPLIEFENWHPIRIGLTGSIGMGKSTITKQFRKLGFSVFDADECVHQLYGKGGEAVRMIRDLFPSAISSEETVDRQELTKLILQNPDNLRAIEKIVHPLVISKREEFTVAASNSKQLIIIYDIPLLFEKLEEYKSQIDYIIVVSCSAETQMKRVLSRPNMTEEKFKSILAKQVSNDIKVRNAHYVIDSDFSGKIFGFLLKIQSSYC